MQGRAGFKGLLSDGRLADVPMILETPKGDDTAWDLKNLALLRELAG